jgi:hypothetical protein
VRGALALHDIAYFVTAGAPVDAFEQSFAAAQ